MPKDGLLQALLDQLAILEPKGYFKNRGKQDLALKVTHSSLLPSGARLIQTLTERDNTLHNTSLGLKYCPFTLIELHLDPSGKGTGQVQISPAVSIRSDGYIEVRGQAFKTFDLLGVTSIPRK